MLEFDIFNSYLWYFYISSFGDWDKKRLWNKHKNMADVSLMLIFLQYIWKRIFILNNLYTLETLRKMHTLVVSLLILFFNYHWLLFHLFCYKAKMINSLCIWVSQRMYISFRDSSFIYLGSLLEYLHV